MSLLFESSVRMVLVLWGRRGVLSWAVGVYFGSGIMVADFLCGLVCEVDAGLLSSKKSQKSVESI